MPEKTTLILLEIFIEFIQETILKLKICAEDFFAKLINIKKYPLTKLENIRSVEMTKVIENSYRATNIAFIDEWTKIFRKN